MPDESDYVKLVPGFDQRLAKKGFLHLSRTLPSMVLAVVRMAWLAAPWPTFFLLIVQAAAGVLSGLTIMSTSNVISAVTSGANQSFSLTIKPILIFGFLVMLRGILESLAIMIQARLTPQVNYFAETSLFTTALHVNLDAHDDPAWHESLTRAETRAVRFLELAIGSLVELVGAAVGLLAVASSLGTLHPILLPLIVLSVLPQGIAALASGKLGYIGMFRYASLRHKFDLITSIILDRSSAAEIRANTAVGDVEKRLQDIGTALRNESQRIEFSQARVIIIGKSLSGIIAGATFCVLLILLLEGNILVGDAGAAAIALTVSRQSLARIILSANRVNEYGLYLKDFKEFLNSSESRSEKLCESKLEAGELEQVKLNSVSFRYRGTDYDAISNISVSLKASEVVAIVGKNGSGKSTLAKIILGLYEPDSGSVEWNDQNLKIYSASSYRAKMGLIAQHPIRWPFSFRDNVEIGSHTDCLDRDCSYGSALEFAGLVSVRDQLTHGDNSLLSRYVSGGSELSGGQWQSVSVARGIFRAPDLLICDEPSSALDPFAEAELYDSFRRLAIDGRIRSLVLISHRLASARWADKIYVMDKGRIIEQGTHADLMVHGGVYKEMFNLQSSGYIDSVPRDESSIQ